MARCPSCGTVSERQDSWYQLSLRNLPMRSVPVVTAPSQEMAFRSAGLRALDLRGAAAPSCLSPRASERRHRRYPGRDGQPTASGPRSGPVRISIGVSTEACSASPGRRTRSLRCGGCRRWTMPRGGSSAAIRDGRTPRRRSARSPISRSRVGSTRNAAVLAIMKIPSARCTSQHWRYCCRADRCSFIRLDRVLHSRSLAHIRRWYDHWRIGQSLRCS